MMTYKCDNCEVIYTTKGSLHRVFYRYKHDDGTDAHILDLMPLWVAHLDPKNLKSTEGEYYDGTSPRFSTILFGPYELDKAQTLEHWEGILSTLNKLGARLLFQMACKHSTITLLSDDADPSHGV